MKNYCIGSHLLAVLLLMAIFMPYASAQTLTGQSSDPPGWKTVWYDDFTGTTLNRNFWNIEENNDGGGNSELQHYGAENVKVENGNLVLTAERRTAYDRNFQSGRVTTQKNVFFTHGKLEARIKMPETERGLWPAFWMLGERGVWPACGEIDIVEMGHSDGWNDPGNNPKAYLNGAFHWGTDYNHHSQRAQTQNEIVVQDGNYHIFTCEWTPDYIRMYLDGSKYCEMDLNVHDDANPMSVDNYFHKPSFIIFNLAVGGMFPGIYDAGGITALPNPGDKKEMLIDWVRISQPENDSDYTYMESYVPKDDTYEPDPDTKPGLWGSKAIDDNGSFTFDLENADDMVLISTTQGVTEMLNGRNKVLRNYNPDNATHHLYIWENTYSDLPAAAINSFGLEEGNSVSLAVSGAANWSGAGFASTAPGKDLSMIDDDYVLHFAMRGGDKVAHASHTIIVGNAEFKIGKDSPLGDYPRDGEWYNFDIPVKVLKQLTDRLFYDSKSNTAEGNYQGNVFAFQSGGIADTKIQLDNIFFYKSKAPVADLPDTDETTEMGRYGSYSLENGIATFDKANSYGYVPLQMSGAFYNEVKGSGKVALDLQSGVGTNFYIWSETYNGANGQGQNSMGDNDGYTALTVSNKGWSDAAFQIRNDLNPDLSIITNPDNNYWLHMAFKADDMLYHSTQTIDLGNARFTIGPSDSSLPSLGDYKRDGRWCSFDIPVRDLLVISPGLLDNMGASSNIFILSTGGAQGSQLNFDNIFFYRNDTKVAEEVTDDTPCGKFMKPSLQNGKSTFRFEDAADIIPIRVSSDVADSGKIRSGYENMPGKTNFWVWDNTFVAGDGSGLNSFGKDEEFTSLMVGTIGWSGAAFNLGDSNPTDLSVLSKEDDYYLHLAIRDNDHFTHYPYQITINGKIIKLGRAADGGLTDFTRDGQWYSLDIPLSEISPSLFAEAGQFTGDFIVFSAGGQKGTRLEFDNVFFYKNLNPESPEPEVPDPEDPDPIEPSDIKYHEIVNGMLPNVYKEGEESSMRRDVPVSMKSVMSYNDDKTYTIRFKVEGADNVVGFVPEVNVGDEYSGSLLGKADAEGYYSYTTTKKFEEGSNVVSFYWLQFNGGVERFNLTTIAAGESNSPIEYGDPAAIILDAPKKETIAGYLTPFYAYLTDENGNFLLGNDYEPSLKIDENDNSASGELTSYKHFVILNAKGTSTVVADYAGLPTQRLQFICHSNGPDGDNIAYKLVPKLKDGSPFNDLRYITDGDEGTQTEFSCTQTEQHSIRIDFDDVYEVTWVTLVWEGASATHYDFSLFVDSERLESNGRQRAASVNYTHEVTDGDGGAGKVVFYDHETASTVYANAFELNTYKAFDPGWGIKLKEVYIYGKNKGIYTGLDKVNADETVEYFNLQGVRVSNPGSGVYIRRQGTEVRKVIIP